MKNQEINTDTHLHDDSDTFGSGVNSSGDNGESHSHTFE